MRCRRISLNETERSLWLSAAERIVSVQELKSIFHVIDVTYVTPTEVVLAALLNVYPCGAVANSDEFKTFVDIPVSQIIKIGPPCHLALAFIAHETINSTNISTGFRAARARSPFSICSIKTPRLEPNFCTVDDAVAVNSVDEPGLFVIQRWGQ